MLLLISKCDVNTLEYGVVPNAGLIPLPIKAYMGIVVLGAADEFLAPPTSKLLPFHPILLAPVPAAAAASGNAPERSGNNRAEPLTSVHVFPSPDVAIVAILPLPTAIHL